MLVCEFPSRRDRFRIAADAMYRVEEIACRLLARRHPFWRPIIWFAITFLEAIGISFVVFFAGLTQIPALYSGRFDDVESVEFGDPK